MGYIQRIIVSFQGALWLLSTGGVPFVNIFVRLEVDNSTDSRYIKDYWDGKVHQTSGG